MTFFFALLLAATTTYAREVSFPHAKFQLSVIGQSVMRKALTGFNDVYKELYKSGRNGISESHYTCRVLSFASENCFPSGKPDGEDNVAQLAVIGFVDALMMNADRLAFDLPIVGNPEASEKIRMNAMQMSTFVYKTSVIFDPFMQIVGSGMPDDETAGRKRAAQWQALVASFARGTQAAERFWEDNKHFILGDMSTNKAVAIIAKTWKAHGRKIADYTKKYFTERSEYIINHMQTNGGSKAGWDEKEEARFVAVKGAILDNANAYLAALSQKRAAARSEFYQDYSYMYDNNDHYFGQREAKVDRLMRELNRLEDDVKRLERMKFD